MAKNKLKNKKSKSGNKGQGGPGSAVLTAQAYFESGRLSRLPLDKIYYGRETIQNEEVHVLLFTRRHINDNISFALFHIYDFSGYRFVAEYDFNIWEKEIEEYTERLQLAEADQIPSLFKLMSDALIVTEIFRIDSLQKKGFTNLILPSTEEVANWTAVPKKVATFQRPMDKNINPESFFNLGHNYSSMDHPANVGMYDPQIYASWTSDDWKRFFAQDYRSILTSGDFYDQVLPCMYILEKVLLPVVSSQIESSEMPAGKADEQDIDKEMDNWFLEISEAVTRELDRLEQDEALIKKSLTEQVEIGDNAYKPTELEIIYENGLSRVLDYDVFRSKPHPIINTLKSLIVQYPENLQFKYLLAKSLIISEEEFDLAEELLKENIQNDPKNPARVIEYIEAAWEYDGYYFEEVMDDQILNNSHLQQYENIYEPYFHTYYLKLGEYLEKNKEYGALLRLYKIMSTYALFKSSEILQKRWLCLFQESHFNIMVNYLDDADEARDARWIEKLTSV